MNFFVFVFMLLYEYGIGHLCLNGTETRSAWISFTAASWMTYYSFFFHFNKFLIFHIILEGVIEWSA